MDVGIADTTHRTKIMLKQSALKHCIKFTACTSIHPDETMPTQNETRGCATQHYTRNYKQWMLNQPTRPTALESCASIRSCNAASQIYKQLWYHVDRCLNQTTTTIKNDIYPANLQRIQLAYTPWTIIGGNLQNNKTSVLTQLTTAHGEVRSPPEAIAFEDMD